MNKRINEGTNERLTCENEKSHCKGTLQ